VSTRQFSPGAVNWLHKYHGSCDDTALLMAFDAGRASRAGEAASLSEIAADLAMILATMGPEQEPVTVGDVARRVHRRTIEGCLASARNALEGT
jgi:hypothetical protein